MAAAVPVTDARQYHYVIQQAPGESPESLYRKLKELERRSGPLALKVRT